MRNLYDFFSNSFPNLWNSIVKTRKKMYPLGRIRLRTRREGHGFHGFLFLSSNITVGSISIPPVSSTGPLFANTPVINALSEPSFAASSGLPGQGFGFIEVTLSLTLSAPTSGAFPSEVSEVWMQAFSPALTSGAAPPYPLNVGSSLGSVTAVTAAVQCTIDEPDPGTIESGTKTLSWTGLVPVPISTSNMAMTPSSTAASTLVIWLLTDCASGMLPTFGGFAPIQQNFSACAPLLRYWWLVTGTDTDIVGGSVALQAGSTSPSAAADAPHAQTAGNLGGSLNFPGNAYEVIPENYDSLEDFTVSCWVKGAAASSSGAVISSVNNGGWFVSFAPQLTFGVTGSTSVSSSFALPDTNWHHAAVSYESTTESVRFYLDGTPYNSSGTVQQASLSVSSFNSSGGNYSIGAQGSSGNFFSGELASLRIFGRHLTDLEVARVYNGFFDGMCLKFNGTNQYVSIPNNSPLQITGNVTISAWIYLTAAASPSPGLAVAGKFFSTHGYFLYVNGTGAYFVVGNTANTQQVPTAGGANNFSLNQWTHVVGVRSGASLTLYINGVVPTGGTATFGGGTNPLTDSGTNFVIGADNVASQSSVGQFANFRIAAVRVYNTALTAMQVQALYNNGFGLWSTSLDTANANLQGWWKLNDGYNSSTAADSSANGNNGSLSGGPTWQSAPIVG